MAGPHGDLANDGKGVYEWLARPESLLFRLSIPDFQQLDRAVPRAARAHLMESSRNL